MRYLEVLKEILPKVFEEVKNDILNEKEVAHFIEDKTLLEALLKKQEQLLTDYLKNFPEETQVNLDAIKEFYYHLKVPYLVVARNIDLIKTKLLERISIEKELSTKEFLLDVRRYIEKLEEIIAKEYIKSDIHQLEDLENSVFASYLLYKAHLDYVQKIIKAIQEDKLEEFPVGEAKDCKFHEYLLYPESIMACMDANLCTYIEDIHQMIHKIANSFFAFYINGKYKDAYVAFKELLDNALKLSKTLSELYFVAYSDAEMNLFKVSKYIENIFKRELLFLIDIRNLKTLNKIYSEEKVNKVLKEIEKTLNDYVSDKKKNLLIVRGSTSNFYMLAVDIDDETLAKIISDIKELVEKDYQLNGHAVEIKTTIAVLELDKYSENTQEDLIKILHYLKEKAKETPTGVYIATDDLIKEEIRQWLNKRYKDSAYIKSKLDNGDIDVVFQPIYDTNTLKIKHLEVLARIKDNNDKLIPAGVFIDLIYELGLVSKLDSLVLQKVQEKKAIIKKVSNSLFLNISSESLTSKEFLSTLSSFLEDMSDFQLTFEITEQKLIKDISVLKKIYSDKHSMVNFAIDDFGTGYSSLKTVADLAENKLLHIIKIDGSLIKELADRKFTQKVVKAIASMSKNLDVETVAEFVEDEKTLNLLRELEIPDAQGYYLSKPKKIEELLVEYFNYS